MNHRERFVRVATATILACPMGLAWVTPMPADADEGEGFEVGELLLPAVIGAVIVVGAVALWRSRRPRGPHPQ